jgi:hypothetical protein
MTSWKSHHGHAGNVAPLEDDAKDLSWKPGGSGADAKARAKELRKYAEQRGMLREIEREKTKEKKTQASPRASETAAVATARMAEHEAEMLEQKKKRDAKDAKAVAFQRRVEEAVEQDGTPFVDDGRSDSASEERPICSFFAQGKCARGARCKFRHEAPAEVKVSLPASATAVGVLDEMPSDAWLHVLPYLSIAGICSVACTSTSLAAIAATPSLWIETRLRTFGGTLAGEGADGARGAAGAGNRSAGHEGRDEGRAARLECCRSEGALLGWARAADEAPTEILLPGVMTSVALAGRLAMSTHEGGKEGSMVRLWEVRNGRKLACRTLKHPPSCCDAAMLSQRGSQYVRRACAVVGDVAGQLLVLDLEVELDDPSQRRPFTPRATISGAEAVSSCTMACALVLPAATRGGAAGGAAGGADEDDEEEDEEEDEEDGEDGEDGEDAAERLGSVGAAPPLRVASAYRDGIVALTSFASSTPEVAWHGSLALTDDALSYSRRGAGALAPAPAQPGALLAEGRTEAHEPLLVSLADGGVGGGGRVLFASYGGMACAIDIERGVSRWASGRVSGDLPTRLDALDLSDPPALPPSSSRHGTRLACYSRGWGLLAVACRRTVTLWDDRAAAPFVARLECAAAPSGSSRGAAEGDGGCVHLEDASGDWSGLLLHLPPSADACIHLYDIRRLGRGTRSSAAAGGLPGSRGDGSGLSWSPSRSHSWSPPQLATFAPSRGRSFGGSFALGGGALVANFHAAPGGGGAAKTAGAFRWTPTRSVQEMAAAADAAAGGAEDEGESEETPRSAGKERPQKKKKPRIVTKGGGYKAKRGGTNRTG